MVSHLNSFQYVEMDGEFIETPCQHFEEVPQTLASTETVTEDPPMKMASLKDAGLLLRKVGVQIETNSVILHIRLISLVWVSLQKLKGLYSVHGSEDLPCLSAIQE